ncbi:hypothetical protein, partial [Xanthovirga aplysinae]|uniref:hypothetical protein n=1 Tax=Xanthovirga aplysinae TaxID=2529853 RepID=UPI0012BC6A98
MRFGPYYTVHTKRKNFQSFGESVFGEEINKNRQALRFELKDAYGHRSRVITQEGISAEEIKKLKHFNINLKGK